MARAARKFYQGLIGQLVAHARHAFAIAAEQEEEDQEAPSDPEMLYLWEWFCHLSRWRERGKGTEAISNCEIDAWSRLNRIDVSPSEVATLHLLYDEFKSFLWRMEHPEYVPGTLSRQLQALAEAAKSGPVMTGKPRGR